MTGRTTAREQRVEQLRELARQYGTLRNDATRCSFHQWVTLKLSCSSADAARRINEAGGTAHLLDGSPEGTKLGDIVVELPKARGPR